MVAVKKPSVSTGSPDALTAFLLFRSKGGDPSNLQFILEMIVQQDPLSCWSSSFLPFTFAVTNFENSKRFYKRFSPVKR
ncbi:unnamed protein product [Lasius platythorax]|uniref:Uncharacterized protein n=1 Tax=Lasius platythorax TaxID=488582 RepID=A0AAV2N005_9HYME